MYLGPMVEAQAEALARRERELEAKARALAEKEALLQQASAELDVSRRTVREKEAALQQARGELGMLHGAVEQLRGLSQLPVGVIDARRYRKASPLEFYDAVLTISNLEDIYIPDKGWQVQVTQKGDFNFSSPRQGVRVIPLGHFNSGKTWLIDQLSGAELPKGATVHTQGISIKEATADGLKIVLLDTVGSNSPMDSLPQGAEGRHTSNGAEAMLQELRVQEDFYRQVCFEIGQVILLVVGQMSHKDQMDLLRLARAIRKDRVRKDIVVVHNLRDWDMDMLMDKSDKDGMNYAERTKKLFGLSSDGDLKVTIGAETKTVTRHSGLFGERSRDAVNVYHYYLTDHRLTCSINAFAIQDMKAIITRGAGEHKSLAEEFATAATKIQNRFASFTVDEPEIVFDPESSRFRIKSPIPEGSYRMKPRDLGAYFTMGSDDPSYNITLAPVAVNVKRGRKGEVVEQRKAYQLQIELPGLTRESLAEIREQFENEDGSGALRREPLEGEHGKQLTVTFQAKLLNVPEGLPEDVAEGSSSNVDLSRDAALYEIYDLGSRHHFREGVRTVKVTLRTGIMEYDNNVDPVITYVDGVLGITLVKQR